MFVIAAPTDHAPVLLVVSELVAPLIVDENEMSPAPALTVGLAVVIAVAPVKVTLPSAEVTFAPRLIPLGPVNCRCVVDDAKISALMLTVVAELRCSVLPLPTSEPALDPAVESATVMLPV